MKNDSQDNSPEDEVYVYKDSGIQERHGVIPLWLKLVAVGLILWAAYYTVQYWDAPSPS